MVENLHFRKKIIENEIIELKLELEKNQEFLNLFIKNNKDLLIKINKNYIELDNIYKDLLPK